MNDSRSTPGRPPYYSVALISAAALAYEILLMRLFSIIQWHHFSYMIIGLALLGYGFSGTLIAVFQERLMRHFMASYLGSLVLFGLASVLCFMLAQAMPFNAEMILWDDRQLAYLLLIFLLLSIPFLFAASAICLAFMRFPESVSGIYARDLIGAGMGGLAVVALLFMFFPDSTLIIIGSMGIAAFLAAVIELDARHYRITVSILALSVIILLIAGSRLELQLSPYKSLSQYLRVDGTTVIDRISSPYGLVSVVESAVIPFRHAPGMSLASSSGPPDQLGLFVDGDNMTAMNRFTEDPVHLDYLDQMTSALPYHVIAPRSVLIVGAGGGADVLQAMSHAPARIDAIELNPQLIEVVGQRYAEYNGGLFNNDRLTVHADDVRGYLSGSDARYDLIQVTLMDGFNATSSGLYALNENYLYTVEALQTYLDHLAPGGVLALTRWVKVPPRDTLKLFATAVKALRERTGEPVTDKLVLMRSWQTSTLLVSNTAFTRAALDRVEAFSSKRAFDIDYAAGQPLSPDSYNRLPQPWFQDGSAALVSDNERAYRDSYKFDLEPATDDRPYFHHSTKWSTLEEVYKLRTRGGMPLIDWGYIVLLLTLLVAGFLSIILIVAPLLFLNAADDDSRKSVSRLKVLLYFLLIGIAFLFMEIALMQKFIQLLHHPLYSFALTITTFLVFAGLGSSLSEKLSRASSRRYVLAGSVTGIVLLGLAYMLLLDDLFALLSTSAPVVKMGFTVAMLAPVALLMGMPFPLALSALSQSSQALVPWAWGINGCASVISASLATLLAIELGFGMVILIAVLLYAAVPIVYPVTRQAAA